VELWFDMAHILNEAEVDQSYYKVFRDFIEPVFRRAAQGFPSSAAQLQEDVLNLAQNVDLRTGVCMSAIWQAARPVVPATQETWTIYQEVVSVIEQFERDVAFQMGISGSWFI
jgi:hypothetical protein